MCLFHFSIFSHIHTYIYIYLNIHIRIYLNACVHVYVCVRKSIFIDLIKNKTFTFTSKRLRIFFFCIPKTLKESASWVGPKNWKKKNWGRKSLHAFAIELKTKSMERFLKSFLSNTNLLVAVASVKLQIFGLIEKRKKKF